jgi:hypothetical protein
LQLRAQRYEKNHILQKEFHILVFYS